MTAPETPPESEADKDFAAAAITGCGPAIPPRVSSTASGITAALLPSALTRRSLPPAQNTMVLLSGVQSMLG